MYGVFVPPEPPTMHEKFLRLCVRREMAIRQLNEDLAFEKQAEIDDLLDRYNKLLRLAGAA